MTIYPFDDGKILIGAVHLQPLPGSPGWVAAGRPTLEVIAERAVRDARTYLEAGFNGLIVENYGDAPFYKVVPAETVAAVTRCAREVVLAAGSAPVGLNLLRNDAHAALACAVAAGGRFVRVNVHTGAAVTDQGLIEGTAAETLRLREALGAGPTGPTPVAIFADVHVKHARTLSTDDIGQAASDTAHRGLADALIVSGAATGCPPDAMSCEAVWALVPDSPLFIGSGLTVENCKKLGRRVRGAIVGSATQTGGKAGNPVELDRAQAIADAFRA